MVNTPRRRSAQVLSHRNRVAAARVQLIIDKRLGRETPEWIRRLAEDEDS